MCCRIDATKTSTQALLHVMQLRDGISMTEVVTNSLQVSLPPDCRWGAHMIEGISVRSLHMKNEHVGGKGYVQNLSENSAMP